MLHAEDDLSDGGPPPLEDMSDILEKQRIARTAQIKAVHKPISTSSKVPPSSLLTSTNTTASRPLIIEPSKDWKEKLVVNPPKPPPPKTKATKAGGSTGGSGGSGGGFFTGFKKGFLLSGDDEGKPKAKSKAKSIPKSNIKGTASSVSSSVTEKGRKTDDIPVLRPKMDKTDALRIDEVQQAMGPYKEALEKSASDWLTPALLSKVSSNPTLAAALSDPTFSEALDKMSRGDVAGAFNMLSPNSPGAPSTDARPDLMKALMECAGLLGDTFNDLAERQEEQMKAGARAGAAEARKKGAEKAGGGGNVLLVDPVARAAAREAGEAIMKPVVDIPQDLPEHEKELLRRVAGDAKLQVCDRRTDGEFLHFLLF
ncbi:hypothetical protein HK102_006886 [Quaeritorhiza haematococci]|nr:hypothetical protein HK102_006886 [Quaeritorhiza haematococci]